MQRQLVILFNCDRGNVSGDSSEVRHDPVVIGALVQVGEVMCDAGPLPLQICCVFEGKLGNDIDSYLYGAVGDETSDGGAYASAVDDDDGSDNDDDGSGCVAVDDLNILTMG